MVIYVAPGLPHATHPFLNHINSNSNINNDNNNSRCSESVTSGKREMTSSEYFSLSSRYGSLLWMVAVSFIYLFLFFFFFKFGAINSWLSTFLQTTSVQWWVKNKLNWMIFIYKHDLRCCHFHHFIEVWVLWIECTSQIHIY